MPLYDYDCAACGRRFEVIHGVHADPPASCPLCGSGPVRKAIAAPAIHYKGSGWAKKERRAGTRTGAGSGSSGEDASERSTSDAVGPDATTTSGDGSGEGAGSSTSGSNKTSTTSPSTTAKTSAPSD